MKNIVNNLRQQPLISWVSIVGTALAIFLIMVMVMMEQVKYAPFPPESNRDRWLVAQFMSINNDNWDGEGGSNGPIGYRTLQEVYYKMEKPEAVTAFTSQRNPVSLKAPGGIPVNANAKGTDHNYWKVMNFTFVTGKPYGEEEFDAGQTVAVLSETTARKLFGTTDAVGREFTLDFVPYRVTGVVKDVTNLAEFSYADAWVPYSSTNAINDGWCDNIMGYFSVIMLANNPADFKDIRDEFNRLHAIYFESLRDEGWTFVSRDRPYTQEVVAYSKYANVSATDMKSIYRERWLTYGILLLVPAINLSSMTHSRLRRQREEIGVRRAFGASRSSILSNLFWESFAVTLLGGLLGIILAVIFSLIGGASIYTPGWGMSADNTFVNLSMILHWSTFGWALLFCFILNLLSASLPAWQASRTDIVAAISRR
ncbi:MAG: ABC transporter permease [Bacteroidales bacterium]|nr:ABC transporter permease [Bacteroidales bacterium]